MKARSQVETKADPPRSGLRLQKVLADAGLGSRRACEGLITAGRVSVDGRLVRELGTRVDPDRAHIRVDGLRVPTAQGHVYLVVNKPVGVVSTMSDPQGRPCLGDLIAGQGSRLFHVGRLDADTEGLILLTNDGELAHRLTHPSFGVPKTYLAEVDGPIERGLSRRLRQGVDIGAGPPAKVDAVRVVDASGRRALLELVLHEGRKHVVRRLLAAAGHPVRHLARTAVGPIQLGSLRAGRSRRLTAVEVGQLYQLADLAVSR